MNKIIGKIITLIVFFIVLGCDKQPGPEQVIQQYLDAEKNKNYEQAYALLSNLDQKAMTFEEYKEFIQKNPVGIKGLTLLLNYKIVSTDIKGDRASVLVEVTGPDITALMGILIKQAFQEAFSNNSNNTDDFAEKIEQKYKTEKDLPTITRHIRFILLKEDGNWKVFLNLAQKKREKENEEKIKKLLQEAKKLKEKHMFVEALNKYNEISQIDASKINKEEIKELEKAIENEKMKKEYIKKYLKLYAFEAKYYKSLFEEKIPGVRFKIKNNGNKTLRKVEVTVFFKDKKGNVIVEEKYYPILATEFSIDSVPLKPGYIWQLEKDAFYKAPKVPDEWQEGAAIAEITDIEFAN